MILDLVFVLFEIVICILGCLLLSRLKSWANRVEKVINLLEKIFDGECS